MKNSDSMTRVNDSTRDTIFSHSDSSHVERNGDLTRHESQLVTRDSIQSHFNKISEPLMDKPSSFAHKGMSIFLLQ